MKICHVCENITKITRCVSCVTCKRSFCFPCISKYFPSHADRYIPKNPADTLKQIKTKQCLYCLKICRCLKCNTPEAIAASFLNPSQAEEEGKNTNLSMEEAVHDSALFMGKKATEMPAYLQRILNKKKVIYTKHQTSVPNNQDIAEEVQNSVHQETENKDHTRKFPEEGGLDESGEVGGHPASHEIEYLSGNKMEAENEADQADVEQEEERSRSAYVSGEVGSGSKMEPEGQDAQGASEEQEIADENEPRQSQEPLSENQGGSDQGQSNQPEDRNAASSGEQPKEEEG